MHERGTTTDQTCFTLPALGENAGLVLALWIELSIGAFFFVLSGLITLGAAFVFIYLSDVSNKDLVGGECWAGRVSSRRTPWTKHVPGSMAAACLYQVTRSTHGAPITRQLLVRALEGCDGGMQVGH